MLQKAFKMLAYSQTISKALNCLTYMLIAVLQKYFSNIFLKVFNFLANLVFIKIHILFDTVLGTVLGTVYM